MDSPAGLKKKRNFKGLKLPENNAPVPTPKATADIESITAGISKLAVENQLVKVDLQAADFDELGELGHGNGGTVKKVLHRPSGRVMARKALFIDRGPNKITEAEVEKLKKQVVRELQILHSCHSDYIVGFYGAFIHEGEILICMEFMDLGSLDYIYHKLGKLQEEVLGKISVAVLEGLIYLYLTHRIIHRDVKPNNILINSQGEVKLCDFGVSGEAIDSVVKTFVGTSAYMSPERIKGSDYGVQSDIWSLGIALMELATGRFPFPPNGEEEKNLAVIELLEYIVNEEVPKLPSNTFSSEFEDFVSVCLIKDPAKRPTPAQLNQHAFVKKSRENKLDMAAWAMECKEKLGK
ncbi:dual specificity mitogen-activated protein kinase [Catenaria anguillulae PL171]|uniref:Dual specificity mitogen-activated protein kinase n=1 Tax=Catenaria anguillulae PL171 TaxID=765915 RepID=A0A1Y2HSD3_9FUNG|nr:dual specificity mitogen-activated protein kinase [Catenaria anguillulae PL171]